MNILIISDPLSPSPGNNANLIVKIARRLCARHSVCFLSRTSTTPNCTHLQGFPVIWIQETPGRKPVTTFLHRAAAKIVDRNGYSDYIYGRKLLEEAKRMLRKQRYDVILSTMEPFFAADIATTIPAAKRILYLMDPPAVVTALQSTPYRNRRLPQILGQQDLILTTPFIHKALRDADVCRSEERIVDVGFPMIENRGLKPSRREDKQIHLLFCGWLYADIRSPRYFLDILSRLDERFVVTFMGRECENLTERFEIHTKARLITLPQQPYDAAQQAMADADIMINIGNSVPVHMPSKTLEYINSGKPFVNFYKMDDCPTLYYTKRYPLCLNLSEQDPDIDAATKRFIAFCLESKGKTVDRADIEREYADCTPRYIAQKILDTLGE